MLHISFPLNHYLPFPLYFSASLPFLSFSPDSTLKSCSICCTACPEARPPQICICICDWVLKPIYTIGPLFFFCCPTLPSTWFYECQIPLCDVRKCLFLAMHYAICMSQCTVFQPHSDIWGRCAGAFILPRTGWIPPHCSVSRSPSGRNGGGRKQFRGGGGGGGEGGGGEAHQQQDKLDRELSAVFCFLNVVNPATIN